MLQHGAKLGREDEAVAPLRIKEWLDAESVARREQSLLGTVPNGEGEHAAQFRHHIDTVPGEEVRQDFGVAMGGEADAGALQFVAQCPEVVDFPVVDDGISSVVRAHRLRATLDVDDA